MILNGVSLGKNPESLKGRLDGMGDLGLLAFVGA
jgi:hypothetical protein